MKYNVGAFMVAVGIVAEVVHGEYAYIGYSFKMALIFLGLYLMKESVLGEKK